MVRARRRMQAASFNFSPGGGGILASARIRPRLSAGGGGGGGIGGGGRRWSGGGGGHRHQPHNALAMLFSAGAAAAAAALLLPLLLARPCAASAGLAALGATGVGGAGPGRGSVTSACGVGCTEGACVRAVDPAPYFGGYYGAGTPDTVFPKGYRTGAACLSCRDGCYFLSTRPNSWITYCGEISRLFFVCLFFLFFSPARAFSRAGAKKNSHARRDGARARHVRRLALPARLPPPSKPLLLPPPPPK
jgi:hypothetical protein